MLDQTPVQIAWVTNDLTATETTLSALLGAGYMLHPHRFAHVSTPIEDRPLEIDALADAPVMGPGSMGTAG